jgi:hypothetical protein
MHKMINVLNAIKRVCTGMCASSFIVSLFLELVWKNSECVLVILQPLNRILPGMGCSGNRPEGFLPCALAGSMQVSYNVTGTF